MVWPVEGTSAVPDGAANSGGMCAWRKTHKQFNPLHPQRRCSASVQTEYARESVLTSLCGDVQEDELCAYDIEWAASHQKDILTRWQTLMQEDAP